MTKQVSLQLKSPYLIFIADVDSTHYAKPAWD